jgi:hypothetical protein
MASTTPHSEIDAGSNITHWGTPHRPAVSGCLRMVVLLGGLTWLDLRRGEIFWFCRKLPELTNEAREAGLSYSGSE